MGYDLVHRHAPRRTGGRAVARPEGTAAHRRRLLVAAPGARRRAAAPRRLRRARRGPGRDVGRARRLREPAVTDRTGGHAGTSRSSSASAACWPARRGARASTCCWRRRSTSTARRTAAATSSASARIRCSARASASPTSAACRRAGSAATVKHFVANDSESERMTLDARVSERALRELYLAPFDAAVNEGGAWAVMAAYNSVNGHTMTESPLLRRVLHEEWGFDGVVMSDWFATRSTEAAARAALDLAMPGPSSPWGDALVAAVRAGEVDEALIDDKVAADPAAGGARRRARGRRLRAARGARRRRGGRRAAPRGGGRVRARPQRGRAAARGSRAAAGRGPRPQRGRGAHARRRQRDGLSRRMRSRRSRACAPRWVDRVEVAHAPGPARERPHPRGASTVAVDGESRCGSWTRTAACSPLSGAPGARSIGSARSDRWRTPRRSPASRSARRCGPRSQARTRSAAPGVGRYRLAVDGAEVVRDDRSSSRRARTSSRR